MHAHSEIFIHTQTLTHRYPHTEGDTHIPCLHTHTHTHTYTHSHRHTDAEQGQSSHTYRHTDTHRHRQAELGRTGWVMRMNIGVSVCRSAEKQSDLVLCRVRGSPSCYLQYSITGLETQGGRERETERER